MAQEQQREQDAAPVPEQELKEAFTDGGKSGSNDQDSDAEREMDERLKKH